MENWTILPEERMLIARSKGNHNRLDFAILLKYSNITDGFLITTRRYPVDVIAHLAQQLGVPDERYHTNDWKGRSIKNHLTKICQFLKFRQATA
jgi:hypothetical protein